MPYFEFKYLPKLICFLNWFFPFLEVLIIKKKSNRISGDSVVYYISRRFNLNETEI